MTNSAKSPLSGKTVSATTPTIEESPSLWSDLQTAFRLRWSDKHAGENPKGLSRRQAKTQLALHPSFDSLGIWIALFVISASALAAGVEFGGRFGLVIGFVATLLLNLWILFISPNQLESKFSSWQLEGRDAWGLLASAKEASAQAGIICPRIALADSDAFFSLSFGMSPSRSTIVFSHALVEKLSFEERRLVVAFEVAKIACQWTTSATAARGLCLLIDWPGLRILTRGLLRFSVGNFSFKRIGFSKTSSRILRLDEWVASLADSREAWARTLWSMDAMVGSKPRRSKVSESALDSVIALSRVQHRKQSKTHFDRVFPSVQTRISALIDRYPP